MDTRIIYTHYLESGLVSTDTRKIIPDSMFFALKGDRFNANEFAQQALDKGARYVVIDEEKYKQDDRCLLVDNVLGSLQDLARYHRSQLRIPFIGLTGSNGKTTSKELVASVLNKKFRTLATVGNLNNHIGVPLTLLSIDSKVEIAVIEMGANHVGEIALLSSIANPTHGFITNIGKAHIGTFGGFDNIIRAKSELYQHLIVNEGIVFINSGNEILLNMSKRFNKPVFYPGASDYYHCELIGADPFVKVRAENGQVISTNLIGTYNFENIAAALCIGKYFGVQAEEANSAINSYVAGNMRSQLVKKEGNTVILDAYNANPSSMKAAIENMAAMQVQNKVVILGDMYELEEEAETEHRNIGKLLKASNFDKVMLCGTLMKPAKDEYPEAFFFESKDALIEELKRHPLKNSTVLVKASRGMGLETVVEFI
ncbi:MAG: UDP-N-acetylmuramoyl-tripeptide--D-alanyl-D-alanine ligase [Chryseolinea sp.]